MCLHADITTAIVTIAAIAYFVMVSSPFLCLRSLSMHILACYLRALMSFSLVQIVVTLLILERFVPFMIVWPAAAPVFQGVAYSTRQPASCHVAVALQFNRKCPYC